MRGDGDARFVQRYSVRYRVLRAVAAGAEDVFVPLVTGDGVGHSGLYQQDFFVFFGHWQHGQGYGGGCGAHGQIGFVVAVSGGQQALAQVRLALVVFFNHDQLFASDHHGAAGGVVQAHHETGGGLLAIGLQRAGFAVNVGDLDFFGSGRMPAGMPRRS